MAANKETVFFNKNRRRIRLNKWEHQQHQKVKSLKLSIDLYLSNEDLLGAPEWVMGQFMLMEKQGSAPNNAALDRYLEGMTIECYLTNESKDRSLMLNGCNLKDFKMHRIGSGDKAEVLLAFNIYSPANVQGRDFCWDMRGYDFWLSADYDQSTLNLLAPPADAAGDSDESEDDEDEDDEDLTGPEHDAAFGATQSQSAIAAAKAAEAAGGKKGKKAIEFSRPN